MKPENGSLLLIVMIGGAIVWCVMRKRGLGFAASPVPNVATNNAGSIPPASATSTVPDGSMDWTTPFYLRYNFPTSRALGSPVIPSYVSMGLPSWFGMQEIPPQL